MKLHAVESEVRRASEVLFDSEVVRERTVKFRHSTKGGKVLNHSATQILGLHFSNAVSVHFTAARTPFYDLKKSFHLYRGGFA